MEKLASEYLVPRFPSVSPSKRLQRLPAGTAVCSLELKIRGLRGGTQPSRLPFSRSANATARPGFPTPREVRHNRKTPAAGRHRASALQVLCAHVAAHRCTPTALCRLWRQVPAPFGAGPTSAAAPSVNVGLAFAAGQGASAGRCVVNKHFAIKKHSVITSCRHYILAYIYKGPQEASRIIFFSAFSPPPLPPHINAHALFGPTLATPVPMTFVTSLIHSRSLLPPQPFFCIYQSHNRIQVRSDTIGFEARATNSTFQDTTGKRLDARGKLHFKKRRPPRTGSFGKPTA